MHLANKVNVYLLIYCLLFIQIKKIKLGRISVHKQFLLFI
jgi:hypothetical protein